MSILKKDIIAAVLIALIFATVSSALHAAKGEGGEGGGAVMSGGQSYQTQQQERHQYQHQSGQGKGSE